MCYMYVLDTEVYDEHIKVTVGRRALKNVCTIYGSHGESVGQEPRSRQSIKLTGRDRGVLETLVESFVFIIRRVDLREKVNRTLAFLFSYRMKLGQLLIYVGRFVSPEAHRQDSRSGLIVLNSASATLAKLL